MTLKPCDKTKIGQLIATSQYSIIWVHLIKMGSFQVCATEVAPLSGTSSSFSLGRLDLFNFPVLSHLYSPSCSFVLL